jgi:hypothetical protein
VHRRLACLPALGAFVLACECPAVAKIFTCSSRATGVTCRNRDGHGLFVARETWRTW